MKHHPLATMVLGTAGIIGGTQSALAQQPRVEPVTVSIGGFFSQWLSYVDQDRAAAGTAKANRFDVTSDSEIHFNGRAVLDNGLTVGFRMELEGNTDSDQIDESFLFVESRFGRVEMGSINNVAYRMHYDAPEVFSRGWFMDDGDLTNVMANTTASPTFDSTILGTKNRFFDNDSDKVNYYTPRFGGFQVGLSYIPHSSQDFNTPESASASYSQGFAAGANFVRSFGAFEVNASAGYMTWEGPSGAPDPNAWNAGLRLGYGGFVVGGGYAEINKGRSGSSGTNAPSTAGSGPNRVDGSAYNVGASYTVGAAAFSLTYANGHNNSSPAAGPDFGDDEFTGLNLAGRYTLGPGVNIEGVLFTAQFKGNNSVTAQDSNKANGAVVGIYLSF